MKANAPNEKPLYEQFTIQGFFAVCMMSLAYWMYGVGIMSISHDLGWTDVKVTFKSAATLYLALWVFIFLVACLIPKLFGNK